MKKIKLHEHNMYEIIGFLVLLELIDMQEQDAYWKTEKISRFYLNFLSISLQGKDGIPTKNFSKKKLFSI